MILIQQAIVKLEVAGRMFTKKKHSAALIKRANASAGVQGELVPPGGSRAEPLQGRFLPEAKSRGSAPRCNAL